MVIEKKIKFISSDTIRSRHSVRCDFNLPSFLFSEEVDCDAKDFLRVFINEKLSATWLLNRFYQLETFGAMGFLLKKLLTVLVFRNY